MKILITGVSGFVGRCLAVELARDANVQIVGTYLHNRPSDDFPGRSVKIDISDSEEVSALIKETAPDEIYHLSAISFMPDAEKDRSRAFGINVTGGLNLLEAVSKHAPNAKVLYTSTSEVYGKVAPSENPLVESRNPAPATFYAASKQCLELICQQYAQKPGLHIVIARPFNHIGPGQSEKFAAPAFAMQIARIEAGLMEPVITTGNLDAERDFSDVRDVVRAYPAMLRQGEKGGVYNVCSGVPTKVGAILQILREMSTVINIAHELDPDRMRPSENPKISGSFEKLTSLTGWSPSIKLETTLSDLLDECRGKIAG